MPAIIALDFRGRQGFLKSSAQAAAISALLHKVAVGARRYAPILIPQPSDAPLHSALQRQTHLTWPRKNGALQLGLSDEGYA